MEDLTIFKCELEQGAMTDAPIYETHSRGKNWMAKIKIDPNCPNGMDRIFCKRAYGDYYYFVQNLCKNDIVEFGADYYSGSGRKSSNRRYGVIISITDKEFEMAEFENHHDAFHFVKKNHFDSTRELFLEKERLEKRIDEINQILEQE